MDKKRYVFDLDKTLLTYNPKYEREFFEKYFEEDTALFLRHLPDWLDRYENMVSTYDRETLAGYLSNCSGLVVTEELIDEWIDVLANGTDTMESNVIEVLEELKYQDKSLAVLTNWFRETQIPRLKRAGLYDYFDDIYTGEVFLKPHKEAYWGSIEFYHPDDCVFIGDHIMKDYIGPKSCGMDAILYDKKDEHHKTLCKVRDLSEIIEEDYYGE